MAIGLENIINGVLQNGYRLTFEKGQFAAKKMGIFYSDGSEEANREVIAQVYKACIEKANESTVQAAWQEVFAAQRIPSNLPTVFKKHKFIEMYAQGAALRVDLIAQLWNKITQVSEQDEPAAFQFGEAVSSDYHHILSIPPGFLPKFSHAAKVKVDAQLLPKIQADLNKIAECADLEKKKRDTLHVLSIGASFRDLEGKTLHLPNFEGEGSVEYTCKEHVIGYGVKTISLVPQDNQSVGIYLCEGTELFPSFQGMMGSVLANMGPKGPATEPFEQDRVVIENHLKALSIDDRKPIVCGHSLGGALTMQIGMYCQDLIGEAFAFNPPNPEVVQDTDKLNVFASVDDFAFWRIGSKVAGKVYLVLGSQRWKQLSINILDILFIIPALVKLIINFLRNVPTHQKILTLLDHHIIVPLTDDDIDLENQERTKRSDYIGYFPMLYGIVKMIMKIGRKLCGWSLQSKFDEKETEKLRP